MADKLKAYRFDVFQSGEYARTGWCLSFESPREGEDESGEVTDNVEEIEILDDPGDLEIDDTPAEAGSQSTRYYSEKYDCHYYREGRWKGGRFSHRSKWSPIGPKKCLVDDRFNPRSVIVAD